ncbi:MAG TPA: DNA mismatch repair endonuclease MutL [Candidatus Fermentibacter daniensis]|nr:DNA mismatch repair endonuclease MutL [Candidatus Fermentibacter daniensis]
MQAIRVLSDEVVNLISAGEVVERPSSIVKELVENSIDAGASSVEVEIERGGRQSITVRDDGSGMSRHDLLLSVQRHATSKIARASDLESMTTLGFRGEALPSIAAVTHMSIVTSDGAGAWRLTIDGGVLGGVEPAARTRGTTIVASGVFFNQPARRKFLRSEKTEESWIIRHLEALAFSRLDVSISLTSDGRRVFSIPAGTLESRVRTRFQLPRGTGAVTGLASDGARSARILLFPERRTSSRQNWYTVLNGRPVSIRAVGYVLESMLGGPSGFPLCVCSLELSPGDYDVNVHPAKLEARMRVPSMIQALVASAVEDATGRRTEEVRGSLTAAGGNLNAGGGGGWSLTAVGSAGGSALRKESGYPVSSSLFETAFELQSPGGVLRKEASPPPSAAIYQVGRSYLVSAMAGGIVIVDPHAAHERILFESIRKGPSGRPGQQRLLLPERLDLDPASLEQLGLYSDMIAEAGFDIQESGGRLMLCAVPEGVRHGVEAVHEILASLSDPSRASLPPQDQIAAAAACAGAVKLGDSLDPVQAAELLDMLFATKDPFHCPHGRPTLIEISYDELARRFGR